MHTKLSGLTFLLCLALQVPPSGAAAENAPATGIAVTDLASRGGDLGADRMKALADVLANEIRRLGGFQVITMDDIQALLNLEQQKIMLACTDDSCLAEIGGALGVPFLVTGNVSKFGESFLVNLKLLDVSQAKVAASVSRRVEGVEEHLMAALPYAVRELMAGRYDERKAAPLDLASPLEIERRRARQSYGTWGHATFWSGAGLIALGCVGLGLAKVHGDAYNDERKPADKDASLAWEGVMWAGFGAGAALLATGAVLWSLAPDEPAGVSTESVVSLVSAGAGPVAGGGFGLSLQGRF